ncbi:metallophosphoesterase family protein, partial [Campylobacter sp. MOP51]|uniref:metallophosphoesterase family protein n=1 Tax=Campylobacter canis TaxID=3378588 RepID=UPI003C3BACD3
MTKIGIISDTHHQPNIALEAIKILKDNGAHIILHAGDIVEARTLSDLKDSKLPYVAVLGNND